jgi:hypothetical protein
LFYNFVDSAISFTRTVKLASGVKEEDIKTPVKKQREKFSSPEPR